MQLNSYPVQLRVREYLRMFHELLQNVSSRFANLEEKHKIFFYSSQSKLLELMLLKLVLQSRSSGFYSLASCAPMLTISGTYCNFF